MCFTTLPDTIPNESYCWGYIVSPRDPDNLQTGWGLSYHRLALETMTLYQIQTITLLCRPGDEEAEEEEGEEASHNSRLSHHKTGWCPLPQLKGTGSLRSPWVEPYLSPDWLTSLYPTHYQPDWERQAPAERRPGPRTTGRLWCYTVQILKRPHKHTATNCHLICCH